MKQGDIELANQSNSSVTIEPIPRNMEGLDSLEPLNQEIKDEPSSNRITWPKVKAFLIKHWFLIGLGISICIAAAYPPLGKKGGYLRTEYTVKYGVVAIIFVITGVSLKTKILLEAAMYYKIHLLVQALSLGIFPAIGLGIGRLLKLSPSFNKILADGLIIATCTPTTISSNVLMTRQAGGNEPAAVVNAVLGNILGVFISPSLIFAYVGSSGSYGTFNYSTVFIDLSITVIGPLILGQVLIFFIPDLVQKVSKYISLAILNSALLLVLVWSVFCDTFASKDIKSVQASSLVPIIFLDVALFLVFSSIAFSLSRISWVKFSRQDTVAIVNCAATKTVALGIPMINIIFGSSPSVGILSTPLLIYHALQLVVGSVYVVVFQKWLRRNN